MKDKVLRNWYWYVVAAFLLFVVFVYGLFGEDSYIAVHDNLDLFVAQFQMMKNTDTFVGLHKEVPFLGGISRDNLPSELSLGTILYMFLPSFAAYVCNYLCKVLISIVSFYLLGKVLLQDKFDVYKPMIVLTGLAYGMINVFPAFGIPFASIPLLIYLVIRVKRSANLKNAVVWYVLLFCYPFLSYFSYFGLFACGYLLLAIIWVSVKERKWNGPMTIGLIALSLGYVCFEYRLFGVMLFGTEETIRSTMAGTDLTLGQILSEMKEVFCHSIFHAEDVHDRWIFYICILYFIILNAAYIWEKKAKEIFHEPFNLVMLWIGFNCVIYGLYDFEPVRTLVETICPPLEGWQFNRTVFFNPFLWYAALFLAAKGIYDWTKKTYFSYAIIFVSILMILLTNTRYNDLFHTCYYQALHIVKGKEIDEMNYREFYGVALFDEVKKDVDYNGEWSVAYGFHPAQLEYNGIATLDGYLGFYSQDYKEKFRNVIAPAIDRVEASRIYFDDWGARAYLYGGTDESIVSNAKSFTITDHDLYFDVNAFKALDGKYIFSRYELSNTDAVGIELKGRYSEETIPYDIYLYQVKE